MTASSQSESDGLPLEMAGRGINAFVAGLLMERPRTIRILVLGSGAGRLEAILRRNGFTNVWSADFYAVRPKDVPANRFIRVDLNDAVFAQRIRARFSGTFDVVMAVEVIEHLYSLHSFLQNVQSLLAPRGRVYLSTPNTHAAMARAECLLTGYPSWFYLRPKRGDHVQPIFDNIVDHLAEEAGLRVERMAYHNGFIRYLVTYPKFSIRSWFYCAALLVLTPLLSPLMLVNSKSMRGLNKVYVLARSK